MRHFALSILLVAILVSSASYARHETLFLPIHLQKEGRVVETITRPIIFPGEGYEGAFAEISLPGQAEPTAVRLDPSTAKIVFLQSEDWRDVFEQTEPEPDRPDHSAIGFLRQDLEGHVYLDRPGEIEFSEVFRLESIAPAQAERIVTTKTVFLKSLRTVDSVVNRFPAWSARFQINSGTDFDWGPVKVVHLNQHDNKAEILFEINILRYLAGKMKKLYLFTVPADVLFAPRTLNAPSLEFLASQISLTGQSTQQDAWYQAFKQFWELARDNPQVVSASTQVVNLPLSFDRRVGMQILERTFNRECAYESSWAGKRRPSRRNLQN